MKVTASDMKRCSTVKTSVKFQIQNTVIERYPDWSMENGHQHLFSLFFPLHLNFENLKSKNLSKYTAILSHILRMEPVEAFKNFFAD